MTVTTTDPRYPLSDLHHVGIVVADLEEGAAEVQRRYGMTIRLFPEQTYPCRIRGRDEAPRTRIGLSVEGPPHLELLREVPGFEPWTPVPGLHHLGYVVSDLAAAARQMEDTGSPMLMGGVRGTEFPVGTTYHNDPLGHIVELLDTATAESLAHRLES